MKKDMVALQQDAIDLLDGVAALLKRAGVAFAADPSGPKYSGCCTQVEQEREKVVRLELVMSVVAPMKAGKSTIVNAIAGLEVLPSRNAAMTTLPTRVFFTDQIDRPRLLLSVDFVQGYRTAVEQLRARVQQIGEEEARKALASYAHLLPLLDEVLRGHPEDQLSDLIEGEAAIIRSLSLINDLVRMCSCLHPGANPLTLVASVPQIAAPMWKGSVQTNEQIGNLVIVDTPGPNEATKELRLDEVVESQLKRSSVVLIVLDYTQLKNEASEKVKQEVEKVVAVRGRDSLYVLVNKVDQRRRNDMTTEEVREFVRSEFRIGSEGDERVFEVAAVWAFSATRFLGDVDREPQLHLPDLPSAQAFAREALGARWESKLASISVPEMIEEAQQLWNDSGFPAFLDRAVQALMAETAPRSIRSALRLVRALLEDLRSDTELRRAAIAKDASELQQQVDALDRDLRDLDAVRASLQPMLNQFRQRVRKQIASNLLDAKRAALVNLEDYFEQEQKERADLAEWVRMAATSGLSKMLPASLARTFNVSKQVRETFEFSNIREAEEFAAGAMDAAMSRASKLFGIVEDAARKQIKADLSSFTAYLRQRTDPIIRRARTRLNQAFQITLAPPPLELGDVETLEPVRPDIKTGYRVVEGGYETRTVRKRLWWTAFIFSGDVTERIKAPDQKISYHTVSLVDLVTAANVAIEKGFSGINDALEGYIEEDLNVHMDSFFGTLDQYLGNYRGTLEQALADQQLAARSRGELIQTLEHVAAEAAVRYDRAVTLASYVADGRNEHVLASR